MPKFMTYQRPARVSKQDWNHAPDRKEAIPRKAPGTQAKPTAAALPPLDQLLRKE
jgi:hypothetical protein